MPRGENKPTALRWKKNELQLRESETIPFILGDFFTALKFENQIQETYVTNDINVPRRNNTRVHALLFAYKS